MGIYNSFVVEVDCPTCNRKRKVSGQFSWGQLIMTTYKLGDKIIWDASDAQRLAQIDPSAMQLLRNYGYLAGQRHPHVVYQSWADCNECRKPPAFNSFGVLLEIKNDVISAAYSRLTDDEAKRLLSELVSGKLVLAVVGSIPDIHEQVARLALFNRSMIAHLGANLQGDHGVAFLRALGSIASYWAHALAQPAHSQLGYLDEEVFHEAMKLIENQLLGERLEFVEEARQIIEEVARIQNESESLRKMQP